MELSRRDEKQKRLDHYAGIALQALIARREEAGSLGGDDAETRGFAQRVLKLAVIVMEAVDQHLAAEKPRAAERPHAPDDPLAHLR